MESNPATNKPILPNKTTRISRRAKDRLVMFYFLAARSGSLPAFCDLPNIPLSLFQHFRLERSGRGD